MQLMGDPSEDILFLAGYCTIVERMVGIPWMSRWLSIHQKQLAKAVSGLLVLS